MAPRKDDRSNSDFLEERFVTTLRFIDISLAGKLPRCVHVVKSYAAVDNFHVVLGHDVGDGSSAALINLAQLAELI